MWISEDGKIDDSRDEIELISAVVVLEEDRGVVVTNSERLCNGDARKDDEKGVDKLHDDFELA